MEATSDLRLWMATPVADKEKGDRVLGGAGQERMSMNAVGKMEGTARTVPGAKAVERPGWLAQVPRLLRRTIGLMLAGAVLVATVAPAAQAAGLHRAVKAGDLDGVTRMLAAGTDVNARDKQGRTALMYAVDKGSVLLVEALLAAGTDVDARDKQGRTALMYAVDKRSVLLVEALLAAQADPNVRALDEATALFMAAVHGYGEIITLLMQAGADPTIEGPQRKGIKGRTATAVAQMRYGGVQAALKQGEPPAVIALLAGKTWAEGEAFVQALVRTLRAWPPGKTFRDCAQCPEMVVVPAGRFQMRERRGVHEVTIATPFAVGKYEVTFAEWDACVAAGGCTHRPRDWGWGRGKQPVISVSWGDAQEYVEWLSRETGQVYRLLSFAEWEYVARGGSKSRGYTYAGSNSPDSVAWYRGNSGSKAHPVGQKAPNELGLYDMSGNVWEWVEDCGDDVYSHSGLRLPNDGSARTENEWGTKCRERMLRGGSWLSNPELLRSAVRVSYDYSDTGDRNSYNGFRLARTLTP